MSGFASRDEPDATHVVRVPPLRRFPIDVFVGYTNEQAIPLPTTGQYGRNESEQAPRFDRAPVNARGWRWLDVPT